MVAMLGLVVALGERLFGSTATGPDRGDPVLLPRIAVVHSLSQYVRLAGGRSQCDMGLTVPGLGAHRTEAEDWATMDRTSTSTENHLASAIGVVLLALVFVVDRLQARAAERASWSRSTETPSGHESRRDGWWAGPGSVWAIRSCIAPAWLTRPAWLRGDGLLLGLLPALEQPDVRRQCGPLRDHLRGLRRRVR